MHSTFEVRKDWLSRFRTKRAIVMMTAIGLSLISIFALVSAYQWALGPRDKDSAVIVRVIVDPGDSVVEIADKLKAEELIRSKTAFRIYTELTNTKARLQAGAYALSKQMSVADIIDHMSTGKTDEFNVRIVPGLTLKQQYDKSLQGSLAQQGFSDAEITAALNTPYTNELLSQRPSGATLEGYIYPDTYRMAANNNLAVIIEKSLEEFSRVIRENDIEARLAARGLTLHEGITLASIIQKEVSDEQDQRQVSQVFQKRLAEGVALGSDVTFIYAAALLGVDPKISLESPYNTRINTGLPPGPIANFNLSALLAVVDPLPGDYLYFVSDKDQNTYFARSLEEHEANVAKYNNESRTEYSY